GGADAGQPHRAVLLAVGRGRDGEALLQHGTGPGVRAQRSPARLHPVGLPTLVPPGPQTEHPRVLGLAADATPWLWQPRATGRA
ncbi:PIG-L family deacetylase, partial [Streptomyces sp. HSW2009]